MGGGSTKCKKLKTIKEGSGQPLGRTFPILEMLDTGKERASSPADFLCQPGLLLGGRGMGRVTSRIYLLVYLFSPEDMLLERE